MSDSLRYPVPAARCRVEQTIDRSRFICDVARASSPAAAQALVREIAAAFPDATHHCWAYLAGPPGDTAQIGMSDDGEPHGTAGRPMLTVLLHSGVGEIVAVVTRDYGGTKLGTGGLVRAYSAVVQAALVALGTVERLEYASIAVVLAYAHLSAVRHLLPTFEAIITSEAYGEEVELCVSVPLPRRAALCDALADATCGRAVLLREAATSA